jgi:signal transduction histidine kinase
VRSFKQVAADQTSNQRREFKLLDVIRENELLLSPRMKKTGIQLVVDIDADLIMESYPGDIGQIITNLVENAMVHAYAGQDHGTIDVGARLRDPDTVTVRITDHGGGIDTANLGRIFDPFFTTRMGRGGTGLGLSIVYSIVTKSLGGKIRAESVVGQGTTFHLELARVAPQQDHAGHAA